MYDSHYDLLTYILMKKNDLHFIEELCKKIYKPDNIKGGIINLYYMTPKKMEDELSLTYINPVEELKYAKEVIESFNLLPNRDNFYFGIEGCSYVKIEDLEPLYNLGLRSINPIYNDDNIYGGGAFGDAEKGLTPLGKKFIEKAVSLGIGIDVSHANRKTTMDILNLIQSIKKSNPNANVYASHSNVQDLCARKRNLSLPEIRKLKEVGGTVGLLCRKTFCGNYTEDEVINNEVNYEKDLMKHLSYLIQEMGIDNVMISSDDMSYHPDSFLSQDNKIFALENINSQIRKLLEAYDFDKESIEKLLTTNFERNILRRKNKGFEKTYRC